MIQKKACNQGNPEIWRRKRSWTRRSLAKEVRYLAVSSWRNV